MFFISSYDARDTSSTARSSGVLTAMFTAIVIILIAVAYPGLLWRCGRRLVKITSPGIRLTTREFKMLRSRLRKDTVVPF